MSKALKSLRQALLRFILPITTLIFICHEYPNHIDVLIAKYLQGEALPNEAMELEDWCNQHISHRDYFNQMQQTTSLWMAQIGKYRRLP